MNAPAEIYYGTQSEKSFLDQMAESPKAVMLLSNYLTSAERRAVWGTIDKAEVIEYARVLYANAIARACTMQRLARVA